MRTTDTPTPDTPTARGATSGAAAVRAAALAATALLAGASVFGAEARFQALVERTLAAEDSLFGGCMASLSVAPHTEGLDCRTQPWVTFDCAGEHVSPSAALRMFDVAQVAQLTRREVMLIVDDTRKHGGFCLVRRIDLLEAVEEQ